MEKALRPERLDLDIKISADGRNRVAFLHWKATLDSFLGAMGTGTQNTALTGAQKFSILINHVCPAIYNSISTYTEYDPAIHHLEGIFVKTMNTCHSRHLLATRRQQPSESIDQYHIALLTLAKDCDFKAANAETHQEECVRTALISGLRSEEIRKRLLESTKSMKDSLAIALSMEGADRDSRLYDHYTDQAFANACNTSTKEADPKYVAGMNGSQSCDYCGHGKHHRSKCPAKDSTCNTCKKHGHWANVCRSKQPSRARGKDIINAVPSVTSHPSNSTVATHLSNPSLAACSSHPSNHSLDSYSSPYGNGYPMVNLPTPYLAATTPAFPSSLGDSIVNIKVNSKFDAFALIDTGSSLSFISKTFVDSKNIPVSPCRSLITMASETHTSETLGACLLTLAIGEIVLGKTRLLVLERLCCDMILGHDVLNQHQELRIHFGGSKPPIEIARASLPLSFAISNIEPPPLFSNLTSDVHPIACGSRRFSIPVAEFISKTVKELQSSGVIRPSNSSWRAQVLVTDWEKPKPRMVVDYSRTINKFTELDAYPLPAIDTVVAKIAQLSIYSTFDLKSAYYQVPIKESEKHFTAFEAAGNLYEFNVIPFGVTNGVAAFQRVMNEIIEKESLAATFAYVDNITVAGDDQDEHDRNVLHFLSICKKYGLTLNHSKTVSSVTSLDILGYRVAKGSIKPDPDRMRPLQELPLPADPKALKRSLGLFSYYSRWVNRYSDRVRPLISDPGFPLSEECAAAFRDIKEQIANSCIVCPNELDLLVLESDASDFALSASLNQGGKPVAFFSRTLKQHERKHHVVEKEAAAIVEACRKWNHYLVGRRFLLVTDQQAVSFMFDQQHHGKVKNEKILRWRVELSALDFDIKYRPGPENVTADCLSRAHCSALSHQKSLAQIHIDLVHPGVVRFHHFVKTKNLPYSLEDVKRVVSQCEICAEVKPQFYKPSNPPLIEATKPFDRISIDFKGILPTTSPNRFMLTIVDEYSRFVWAYPCSNMEAPTVIRCLTDLFSTFGTAGFVHSDRGPSLISKELRAFLLQNGISFSNSSKYNPRGNGQVERFNGVIWTSVELALRSRNLGIQHWELVLPEVLHCQRTLLCTATNTTPHERLFSFARRTASGMSLPSWLLETGPVLVKRHVRKSKYVPLVTKVDLVSVNPSFARVRYPCGREDSVSLRHLAPFPKDGDLADPDPSTGPAVTVAGDEEEPGGDSLIAPECVPERGAEPPNPPTNVPQTVPLRRSSRTSVAPDRYQAGT